MHDTATEERPLGRTPRAPLLGGACFQVVPLVIPPSVGALCCFWSPRHVERLRRRPCAAWAGSLYALRR